MDGDSRQDGLDDVIGETLPAELTRAHPKSISTPTKWSASSAACRRFLADMNEDTIPLEAGIEDRAISFTKGCYVGQEVIVRVTHRGGGRVAKRLVRWMAGASRRDRAAAGARDLSAVRQGHRPRHQRRVFADQNAWSASATCTAISSPLERKSRWCGMMRASRRWSNDTDSKARVDAVARSAAGRRGVCLQAPSPKSQDPSPPGSWFKGNLHTHTLNSDGDSTPDDVVRWYREHGYNFVMLTDHNYLTSVTASTRCTAPTTSSSS